MYLFADYDLGNTDDLILIFVALGRTIDKLALQFGRRCGTHGDCLMYILVKFVTCIGRDHSYAVLLQLGAQLAIDELETFAQSRYIVGFLVVLNGALEVVNDG